MEDQFDRLNHPTNICSIKINLRANYRIWSESEDHLASVLGCTQEDLTSVKSNVSHSPLGELYQVSPEGMCGPGKVDNPSGQYGMDMVALTGKKRIIDGPVEKVVKRRQRRRIKNRKSCW